MQHLESLSANRIPGAPVHLNQPDDALVKLMQREWAEEFASNGCMRFGNLECYRKMEASLLRDPSEGVGCLNLNGHPMHTHSLNYEYAWCASLASISASRTHDLALCGKYNCRVRIQEPAKLIERINEAINEHYNSTSTLHLTFAKVIYDKGKETDPSELPNLHSRFLFQKHLSFSEDHEYRLILTDMETKSMPRDHIDLIIGNCSDIIVIESI